MRLRVCLPLGLALAVTACGDSSSSSTAIPNHRVAHAVQQLDEIVADVMERTGVPGMAVAVVHENRLVYAKGFGVRRLGETGPIDAATVFQLASVSKSVGATVVAAQVGKGIISWDTPVHEYLPWFAMPDPATTEEVTVGDLYAHRSGLPDHAGDDLEELGYGRLEVLERLHLLPAVPLRSEYKYTNFGLTAAAQAVAQASGTSWEDLSERVLYRPLGMSSTSSRYADYMARPNRAVPHVLSDNGFVTGPQRQPDAQSPAGGVSSNLRDMAQWMNLVLNEGRHNGVELVPQAALTPALSPQIESSPASEDRPAGHYGYGFNVSTSEQGHVRYGHSGAFLIGASTSFTLLPAAHTGIIALANAEPVGAVEAITNSYIDLVETGHLTRDWLELLEPLFEAMRAPMGEFAGAPFPQQPSPPLPAHAYIGTYANDYFGEASVVQQADGLALVMGPGRVTFPLRHWDGNVFVTEMDGEVAPTGSRSAVVFEAGPNGVAQSLTVELLNEDGQGTLTRQ